MTYSKKVNEVVKLYLTMCAGEMPFKNGKPTTGFWRIRNFMMKQEENLVDILYDYLVSIKQPIRATLTQAIGYAKEHQVELKWKKDKEEIKKKPLVTSDAYNLDAFLNL